MKTLVAVLLLALASPAYAITCTGRVKIDVADGQGLYPKGYKQFSVGACVLEDAALQKRALRTCPMGSWCRIEGAYAGDAAIETITSVTRTAPVRAASKGYWLLLLTAWRGFEGETFVTDKTYTTEKECITKGLYVAEHGPFPEDLYKVRRDKVSSDCAWVP